MSVSFTVESFLPNKLIQYWIQIWETAIKPHRSWVNSAVVGLFSAVD